MRFIIHMDIEPGNDNTVSIKRTEQDKAHIFITASDNQRAQELLQEGQEQAAAARWMPTEEKTERQYYAPALSVEEAEKALASLQETAKGARFMKSLEQARKFTHGHSMSLKQVKVFCLIAYSKGAFYAVSDAYNYAYKRGYESAKRAAKV